MDWFEVAGQWSAVCQERTLLTSQYVNRPGIGQSVCSVGELPKNLSIHHTRQQGFLTVLTLN